MFPPHLPPPTSNIASYRMRQRLYIILAAAGFGLFGGVVGASIMLGWIWPGFGSGDIWINSASYRASNNKGALDETVARTLDRARVVMYSAVSEVGKTEVLNAGDRLGAAMVVGSEGWVVMKQPAAAGNTKNWRAVLNNGALYSVEQAVSDPVSGLLYLKLTASGIVPGTTNVSEQFSKPVTFAAAAAKFDDVYVWQNSAWQRTFIESSVVSNNHAAHLDSAPVMRYELNKTFSPGAIVVTNDGQMVGVVAEGAYVLPASAINKVWASVSTQHKAIYATLGAVGWFSAEQPIVLSGTSETGFVVVRAAAPSTLLRRGDVVLKINGHPMAEEFLANALEAGTADLVVSRSGKTINITTPVLHIPASSF